MPTSKKLSVKTESKTGPFNLKNALYGAMITIVVAGITNYNSGWISKLISDTRSVTRKDRELIKDYCPTLDYKIIVQTLHESDCKECFKFADELVSEITDMGYTNVELQNVNFQAVTYPKYNGHFFIGTVSAQKLTFIYVARENP